MTGTLPGKYQPRSLVELAGWAGMPARTVTAALSVLESFGWVERSRPAILCRGLSTAYQPQLGRTRPARPRNPLSGAERARRYRTRKRGKPAVTPQEPRHGEPAVYVTKNLPRMSRQESVTKPQASGGPTQLAGWGVGLAGPQTGGKIPDPVGPPRPVDYAEPLRTPGVGQPCPLCGGIHDRCVFGKGLYCQRAGCRNPHHRAQPLAAGLALTGTPW